MKKLVLAGIGLFMMAGFLSVNANSEDESTMGCIFTSCLGTMCHDDFLDTEFAADAVEFIEDNICDPQ
ncbi:MAG: hypothetical protein Q4G48_01780 [Bacteroidia bacterium]|nr:hypothetical protein [Bacteroidia bacterium]